MVVDDAGAGDVFSLVLVKASPSRSSGTYVCAAANVMGRTHSNPVVVRVQRRRRVVQGRPDFVSPRAGANDDDDDDSVTTRDENLYLKNCCFSFTQPTTHS